MSRRPEHSHRAATPGNAGFTLLEVLVALAVCGMFVGTLAPVFTANAIRARSADGRLALVAAGHHLLEILPARKDLEEGELSGALDGVKWRLSAIALPPDDDDQKAGIAWTPYRIVIDFTAPNGATKRIETVRLGQSKPR